MLQQAMHKWFPRVLTLLFILSIVMLLGYLVVLLQDLDTDLLSLLGMFVPLFIGVVLVFGVIYVLVDIRDTLKKREEREAAAQEKK